MGNIYNHARCFGYGSCGEENICDWTCGEPACLNLEGVEFGDCERALGVGVIGQACQNISGCSDFGLTFFDNVNACRNACLNEDVPVDPMRRD